MDIDLVMQEIKALESKVQNWIKRLRDVLRNWDWSLINYGFIKENKNAR